MKRGLIVLFLVSVLLVGFMFIGVIAQDEGDDGGGGDGGGGDPGGGDAGGGSEPEPSPEPSDSGGGGDEGDFDGGEGDFGGEGGDEGFEGEGPGDFEDRGPEGFEDRGPPEGFEDRGPGDYRDEEPDFGEGPREEIFEFEDFDENEIEDFADDVGTEDKFRECEGRSEINENGEFLCIYGASDGEVGIFDEQCPNFDDVVCEGGQVESAREGNCDIPICARQLEDFNELDDPEQCGARGGEYVSEEGGEGRCITLEETTIIDELGPISEKEIREILSRIEEFKSNLQKVLGKFEGKEGDEFDDAKIKLAAILTDLDTIKEDLSGEVTEEQRRAVISSLKELQKRTERVFLGIKKGKVIDKKYIEEKRREHMGMMGEFTPEELKEFAEQEKTALGYVRECEIYSKENPKEFVPPDPTGMVVNVILSGLDEQGRCLMELTFNDNSQCNLNVPDYKKFNPETSFSDPDLVKEGDCDKLDDMGPPQDEDSQCMDNCLRGKCSDDMSTLICMAEHPEYEQECSSECFGDMGPPEDMEGEFGPGMGPPGDFGDFHGPEGEYGPPEREGYIPPVTGEVVADSEGENIFTKFINWLKGLFSFGEDEVELSEGDSKEDITADLLELSDELDAISEDLS